MTEQTNLSLSEFAESLPGGYQQRYNPAQIAAHAHVASTRGADRANVGTFPSGDPTRTAVCVVADDRPGLLATISEALVDQGLEVDGAEAYTRTRPDGRREAVDLFWLHAARPGALSAEGLSGLRDVLNSLLAGERRSRPLEFGRGGVTQTTVRFIEGEDGLLNVLEVETDDRSGLLLALSRALFELDVQITSSQIRTSGRRVFDRFTLLEPDGSPIDDARRLTIQVAVLTAIDPVPAVERVSEA